MFGREWTWAVVARITAEREYHIEVEQLRLLERFKDASINAKAERRFLELLNKRRPGMGMPQWADPPANS